MDLSTIFCALETINADEAGLPSHDRFKVENKGNKFEVSGQSPPIVYCGHVTLHFTHRTTW